MKQTKKLTLSAMLAAVAAVLMLVSYFPYLTYAVPAVAGGVMAVAVIELSTKWAWVSYAASVLPVALFAESEAKLLYVCFLGFYPILKSLFERWKSRVAEYAAKFGAFNLAVAVIYLAATKVLGLPMEDMGVLGRWGVPLLWIAANGVFLLYDIALTRVIGAYMWRLHGRVKNWFK